MTEKQFKRSMFFAAAAAGLAYSALSGKGIFNKSRFREQHEALARYVDGNYPNCSYSNITAHGGGWASVVKRFGKPIAFLYFTKSADGVYVFTETKQKLN